MTAQSPVQGNGAQETDSESSGQSQADVSFPIQTTPTIRPVLVWMVITVALAAAAIGYIAGNVEAVGGQDIANILVQVVGAIAVLVLVRLAIKVFVLTRTEYLVDESRIRRQYSLLMRTWEREVPAEMIRSRELRQSRIQKLLGYGTIEINRGLGDIRLENVANPHEIGDALTLIARDDSDSKL
jgi:hypothetical protein